ncbi:MAG TPA: NAD-dependent epimerase/dehydratase family protein [Actinophytocola sp.]|uniref:NAD-dependent epimerase/dehydratase family protein n=1 Tax=Actinophytocola sp. TaxID=1872138 RepID=UPI002DDDAF0A|nr:NAD-dependent epimerase/dehydratase family protein [Actinophytocola sp.]HEV2780967.1 NAD-dependent epimerase/dehydratase family protein [Actinophytocola sp.]
MRVLVIGSTGVLGREAVPRLLAAGHRVTGLARNPERAAAVRGLGIEPVVGDLFDSDSMAKALDGCEAVLNLATRIPTRPGQMMRGMAENDRVRAEGSRVLVEAALRSDGVRVIVQEGISFLYADGGDAELDEDAPIDPVGPLRSSVQAHATIARFAEADGRVGVRLRIAALIDDEPMARMLLRLARLRLPVMFGDPAGWFSAIHPSDAAAGAVAALTAPSGVYNVAATPMRKSDVARVVAEAAGVRRARVLRRGLVPGQLKAFARSQRVVSGRLTEATGWRPARPTLAPDWFPRSGK